MAVIEPPHHVGRPFRILYCATMSLVSLEGHTKEISHNVVEHHICPKQMFNVT